MGQISEKVGFFMHPVVLFLSPILAAFVPCSHRDVSAFMHDMIWSLRPSRELAPPPPPPPTNDVCSQMQTNNDIVYVHAYVSASTVGLLYCLNAVNKTTYMKPEDCNVTEAEATVEKAAKADKAAEKKAKRRKNKAMAQDKAMAETWDVIANEAETARLKHEHEQQEAARVVQRYYKVYKARLKAKAEAEAEAKVIEAARLKHEHEEEEVARLKAEAADEIPDVPEAETDKAKNEQQSSSNFQRIRASFGRIDNMLSKCGV